jgi:hypothetical protein
MIDFFAAAGNSGSKIAGIINADCMMINRFEFSKHFPDHLDGIVIAERVDLSKETLRPTGLPCFGFDAFFFDVAALAHIDHDDHWRIGEVWWDYWLPLAFHVAGFEIKTLPAPILLHLQHSLAWDWDAWATEFSRLLRLLDGHSRSVDRELTEKLSGVRRPGDVEDLQHLIFAWLKSREPLWRPQVGSVDDLVTSVVNASAVFAQPDRRKPSLLHRLRDLLRRMIDTFGLRRLL